MTQEFTHKNKHSLSIVIIAGFLFLPLCLHAQIQSFYLRHDNYEYAINPAVTGRDYYPVVSISHKKYSTGTAAAPSLTSVGGTFRMGAYNFYTPKMLLNKSNLTSKSRMGLGAFMMYEQDGPLSSMYTTLNYAYFVPLDRGASELSFGLSVRLQYNHLNQSMLKPLDTDDPYLMTLDDSELIPDATFGVYYHGEQFFAGASAQELFRSAKPLTNKQQKNDADFFVHGGYKFFLKRFELEPSAFLGMIDGEDLYYYGRLKLYYFTYNWVSLAYRSTQTLNVALGFKINRFHIGYAYDAGISQMTKYFHGSHEIILGLNIGVYQAKGIRKTAK